MANEQLKAAAQKELLRRQAEAEIDRRKAIQTAPQLPQPQQSSGWQDSNSVGGVLGNVFPSAHKAIKGVVDLGVNGLRVANGAIGNAASYIDSNRQMTPAMQEDMQMASNFPSQVAGMAHLANGGIGNLVQGGLRKVGVPESYLQTTPENSNDMQMASQAFEPVNSGSKAAQRAYEDPIGAALMVAPALGGASKLAAMSKMNKISGALSKASEFSNPVNLVAKPLAAAKRYSFADPIEGQTRASSALLRRAAPKDLSAFDKLGPDAMVLDASPSMTGYAQGASTVPNAAKNDIYGALKTRDEKTYPALREMLNRVVGKARDPEALKESINKFGQRQANPYYKIAKQNTPEFRSDALTNIIQRQLTDPAKGMTETARTKNMGWMNQIEDAMKADNPQDAASRLHGLRQELDNVTNPGPMATATDRNIASAAQNARNTVDDILKNRIPGFREGDAIISKSKKAQEAVDYGYNSLEGGKGAVFPESFSKALGKTDRRMVMEGQKGRIMNALGTQANDLSALKKIVGGDGDFNRVKLNETMGPQRVDQINSSIDARQHFRNSYNSIANNSQTAQRQAAAAELKNSSLPEITTATSMTGLGVKGIQMALNKLLAKGVSKFSSATAESLTNALLKTGPEGRALLEQIIGNKKAFPQKPINDKALRNLAMFGQLGGTSMGPQ
jgi:hypothetical protein